MRGATLSGNMFASGSVKSKLDAVISPGPGNIALTGPYYVDDPTYIDDETIEIEMAYYTALIEFKNKTGRSVGQYNFRVAKTNVNWGEPNDQYGHSRVGIIAKTKCADGSVY